MIKNRKNKKEVIMTGNLYRNSINMIAVKTQNTCITSFYGVFKDTVTLTLEQNYKWHLQQKRTGLQILFLLPS